MRLIAKLFAGLLALLPMYAFSADADKSISKAEATKIANNFFANEIRIEGGVTEPHLEGDYWIFPLRVGAAGNIARDPIRVNRFDGKATWAGSEPQKP